MMYMTNRPTYLHTFLHITELINRIAVVTVLCHQRTTQGSAQLLCVCRDAGVPDKRLFCPVMLYMLMLLMI